MAIAKIEVERFSVISSKPFEKVVEALKGSVGRLNVGELTKSSKSAGSFADLEKLIGQNMGSTGLMLFEELDHGAVLRKESGLDKPKILRFLIGNPLVMKEMAKHVPDAGSYAPTTVLVDERADGVHLSYDRMTSFLAPYGNAQALAVARDLDAKVERVLREAAASWKNETSWRKEANHAHDRYVCCRGNVFRQALAGTRSRRSVGIDRHGCCRGE